MVGLKKDIPGESYYNKNFLLEDQRTFLRNIPGEYNIYYKFHT
jgi:hypothetical protein